MDRAIGAWFRPLCDDAEHRANPGSDGQGRRPEQDAPPGRAAEAGTEPPARMDLVQGSGVQPVSSVTSRIIWPPTMKGGRAASASRRPHSTPIPVGPYTLWPEKA